MNPYTKELPYQKTIDKKRQRCPPNSIRSGLSEKYFIVGRKFRSFERASINHCPSTVYPHIARICAIFERRKAAFSG